MLSLVIDASGLLSIMFTDIPSVLHVHCTVKVHIRIHRTLIDYVICVLPSDLSF